jgi:photosystem II stability/assembly factor-like uncharacterized protein
MKHLLFTFTLIAAFIFQDAYSQGWSWQNPTVNGNNLNSVQMVSGSTGYAAGNAGTIVKTTNNGASWTTMYTGTATHIYSISFVDINVGYAAGMGGLILKTIDGGNSWDSLASGTTSRLFSIEFLNTNTGYASGESGRIIKTTDAGATWVTQTTPNSTALFAMDFVDVNTGYASGNLAFVFKTTNGGANWFLATTMPGGYATLDMHFVNDSTGFASNMLAQVLKTNDGGNTWQESQLDDDYYPWLESIYFVNENTGYVAGGESEFIYASYIYKTTNGGDNWTRQLFDLESYLFDIHFSSPTNGIAVGESGQVYRTTDGGTSWDSLKQAATTLTLNNIHFPTPDTGYSVAWGTVIKTTNAGANWFALQHPNVNHNSDGVFFVNGNTGFIGAEQNTVWKTTNGGATWEERQSPNFSLYHEFYFTNATTGYMAGAQGKISKTTDGGDTWFGQTSPNTWDLKDIHFVNENTGFIAGIQGTLLKTTNGGTNWVLKPVPTGLDNFSGIDFYGDTGIAVITNFGGIIRTTDLGETWTEIPIPTNLALTGIDIVNSTTAYASGWAGTILKTTDAGLSWTRMLSSTDKNLEGVYFPTENSGYVIGTGGVILNLQTTGTFVRGTVRFEDDNQPVSGGRVLAVKLDRTNNQVIALGSGVIQSDGKYSIPNLRGDTTYIVAYPNSDLDFVPTYYPSTIDWHTAVTILPNGSINNIDVEVYRTDNPGGTGAVNGGVFRSARVDSTIIDYAVIYAKLNGQFKKYSTSISNGDYNISGLPNGTYEIIANRIGFENEVLQITVNNSTVDTNIYMNESVTSISHNGTNTPGSYELKQNYPNPFNPVTKIQYSLPSSSLVRITVYDITGRKMASLVNTFQNTGTYTVTFDGSSFASGVYFYTLEAKDFITTKKMLLVK